MLEWRSSAEHSQMTSQGCWAAAAPNNLQPTSTVCRAISKCPWQVWDAENLTCLATLSGHQGPVRTLVRCGDKVFSGSYDKTVRANCNGCCWCGCCRRAAAAWPCAGDVANQGLRC